MRFHADGPNIPDILLECCDAGRVVFLCGAGVSSPSGMPDFVGLTKHVIDFFDPSMDSEIISAFQPWLDDPSGANMPLDQIFNLLHQEYGKDEVNALVTERLSTSRDTDEVGREHSLIKRISSNQSGIPQIVTTNFDHLFEARGETYHVPPSFPDLSFGTTIEGITYLHGRLASTDSVHHPYVLSSADFGRAYLSEGWATNFIRNLLKHYTVVLVGYKAEDPPIKYLLQGLNHDGRYDASRLYAFDRGLPEEIEAKWRDRGVTAIAYADHPILWTTMEAWADRSDDSRKWRASVIATSQRNPKDMAPHERGQVAHVLRNTQGMRLFSEADPAPHPEWICVIDANVRSAKPSIDDAENVVFDPKFAYGLDDDLNNITEDNHWHELSNDNLLVWHAGDDSPHDFHRLAGCIETTPSRLQHLITWIGRSIDSPILAWWVIRQNNLHPRLVSHINQQVLHSKSLHERGRHIWQLIIEHHRSPNKMQIGIDWFDFHKQVTIEGWTTRLLRQFRQVSTPKLDITPPYGLNSSKPPSKSWDELRLEDLGRFTIECLEKRTKNLNIPDEALPHVFSILEDQLRTISGLLSDTNRTYFPTPTCYPNREILGRQRVAGVAKVMSLFTQLFDRFTDLNPMLANAHATTWLEADKYFFRKLKLYSLSKDTVFDANSVADTLLSFSQEALWDPNVVRELLFLLEDRWSSFSLEHQRQLTERILAGPDKLPHWSNEEYSAKRIYTSARYGRYLELRGCIISATHSSQLAVLIQNIPHWNDEWATSIVMSNGPRLTKVDRDETPDALLRLSPTGIVEKAIDDLQQNFGRLTEKRSFSGLVKTHPRRAMKALSAAGRSGRYPTTLWATLVTDLPDSISPRLKRVFLYRLARLPSRIIVELRYTLGSWLEQNLFAVVQFDNDLGWMIYDHIVGGILSGGADAVISSLGDVHQNSGEVEWSRRTYEHAINSPLGMCTNALFSAIPSEPQDTWPEQIKVRLKKLLASSGEGADHAVSISMKELNWLMTVDPVWTRSSLIPLLEFEHQFSEPAWNGFLSSNNVPCSPLIVAIKPLLINLFPYIEGFSWEYDLSDVAASWLSYMCIFHANESNGLRECEMREALRLMSDKSRCRVVFYLSMAGQDNENGWRELVVPFINNVWPREHKYRTTALMREWVELLEETDDSFPSTYEAVKKFLAPFETDLHSFYRLTMEIDDNDAIVTRFPESTLDLINTVTPKTFSRPPYELPKILSSIAETDRKLTSDPRYLRLIDLVERT